MRLTVQVKLLPTREQSDILKDTLRASNAAANEINEIAWKHCSFGKYRIHKLAYHAVRASTRLASQMVIRAIAKVANAYKHDKKRKRKFKPFGAIAYDDRILSWKEAEVSIWTVAGREIIPFACDERTREFLALRRGETSLLFRGGKWFLIATVVIEELPPETVEEWVGVDLGITNIATDSEGETYSGSKLKGLRHRYHRVRSRLQSKGTHSAKRRAKKRRQKERRMARDVNHVISKRIVAKAQRTKSGIALEELRGIRGRVRVRRRQRRTMHFWGFDQLRRFIVYKAALAGVPVVFVDPRNTSRECPECGYTDKRNRPSRSRFRCGSCAFSGAADHIAAGNTARRAAVNPLNAASDGLSVA